MAAPDLSISARLTAGPFTLDVELEVAAGPVVLIGPNGSGKSTLLRAVAGGDVDVDGHITVRGTALVGPGHRLSPEDRRIGYVPQDSLLFPHLGVVGNVTYGLRKLPRANRDRTALALLGTLDAAHLADRPVRVLSGGEAQRVAIARALAPSPALLLLDEPTAAVDITGRASLRALLATALHEPGRVGVATTHDVRDVTAWGGTVALVRNGRVRPVSNAADDPFVREFLGPVRDG